MRRILFVAMCVLLLAGPAPAEEDEPTYRIMPFSVRDTNAARFAVKEVRRLLAERRVRQGLALAQGVIDNRPDDFFRIASQQRSTRWRLAAEEMRDLLANLPTGDRAVYEQLSAPSTKPLMDLALRTRDSELLEDIVHRYGASTAGREAARLLADIALEDGRPRDAIAWTRAGLRYKADDVGLIRRRIDALGAAGDGDGLAKLRLPDDPDTRVDLGDVAAHLAKARAALPPTPPLPGWPMWGGNPAHGAVSPVEGPAPDSLRWAAPMRLPIGDLDRDFMSGRAGRGHFRFEQYWRSFRPIHPVVDGRVVYVSNGRAVHALDLYSGAPVWTFDWENEHRLSLLQPEGRNEGRTSFERAFAPTLAGDLLITTVEVAHPYVPERLQGIEISTYLPRRILVALDRHTGALVWWMGREEEDERALEEVTVVSPCVVAEGLVVAVAARFESYHHLFMLALDAKTGEIVWQRSLAWGQQESNLFGSPVKELAASVPAVQDGTVYAATGLGFVAALDLHSGLPRWLASYEIVPIEAVEYWYTAPLRWTLVGPSPPVVSGDLLLVAPTDGVHLSAFDTADGSLRWRVPLGRTQGVGAPAQFLGVANDGTRDVALLTAEDLAAHSVADGEIAWIGRMTDEYGEHNVPVGRGAVTEKNVLVPTTNGLVRFSLLREGSFEGRVPWPLDVAPGNVLPLAQVLLVSARDSIQGFYSWDEIEQDLARRRELQPDDATILLEAGEIYRMGGALDRAQRAFRKALDVARRTDGLAERVLAERGLFRTWISAALAARLTDPEGARRSLRNALTWARTATERVEARVRLDALLEGLPELRVANLEHLADEAENVRARFPGAKETAPARAMALLRLAAVHQQAEHASEAIEALQRLLRTDGDTRIDGLPARDHARRMIDEIVAVWGAAPYSPFEKQAARLLAEAERTGDGSLLDRILAEYPNATIVPDALLRLGLVHVSEGRAAAAADTLRRLLSDHPDGKRAPQAAASLSLAYEAVGLPGAAKFARAWLETRRPDDVFEIQGERTTGRAFATSHRKPPRLPLPDEADALHLPLEERHFESVDDESWGRQIEVAAEDGRSAPVALLSDGRSLVAFDLVGAKRAFRLESGPYHRALYSDGVLVLAAGRALRGVTADTGQTLWEAEIEGTVLDLEASNGQGYALLHDAGGRRGLRRVLAFDAIRGTTIWELDVEGGADVREIRAYGPDVLLRELRHQSGRFWPAMLVVDGISGRQHHVVGLPPESRTEGEILLAGRHLIVASRDEHGQHHVSGHALDVAGKSWTRELPGRGRTCALVTREDRVLVLQEDGHLGTYLAADGEPVHHTQVFTGQGSDASPFHGTGVLLDAEHLYLMPRASRPPWFVGGWSLETGKIVWHTQWEGKRAPGRSALAWTRGGIVALTPYASNRAASGGQRPPTRVLLRILDLQTGQILQKIEPIGLAPDYGLISMAQGWGTVVVFGKTGAGVYAGGR